MAPVARKLGRKMGRSLSEGILQLENYQVDPLPAYNGFDDFTHGLVDWGMGGNDEWGDCGVVGDYHKNMADALTGNEAALPTPDTGSALCGALTTEYFTYEGSPGGAPSPQYDNGVDLNSWLAYRMTHPLAGIPPIAAYAQFDVTNGATFQSCIHTFGGVYVGINLSQEAFDQYPRTFTSTATDFIGGHCVPILARNSAVGKCITWSTVQEFTWPWWRVAREEGWVIFTQEMVNAPGGVWNGVNVTALMADCKKVNG